MKMCSLSTACLSKMLSNATWAHLEATRLGVQPLMNKYWAICQRLRKVLKSRMVLN